MRLFIRVLLLLVAVFAVFFAIDQFIDVLRARNNLQKMISFGMLFGSLLILVVSLGIYAILEYLHSIEASQQNLEKINLTYYCRITGEKLRMSNEKPASVGSGFFKFNTLKRF